MVAFQRKQVKECNENIFLFLRCPLKGKKTRDGKYSALGEYFVVVQRTMRRDIFHRVCSIAPCHRHYGNDPILLFSLWS